MTTQNNSTALSQSTALILVTSLLGESKAQDIILSFVDDKTQSLKAFNDFVNDCWQAAERLAKEPGNALYYRLNTRKSIDRGFGKAKTLDNLLSMGRALISARSAKKPLTFTGTLSARYTELNKRKKPATAPAATAPAATAPAATAPAATAPAATGTPAATAPAATAPAAKKLTVEQLFDMACDNLTRKQLQELQALITAELTTEKIPSRKVA